MTPADARARFPVLERYAYLNAGTFGPLSRATLDAIVTQQRRDAEEGRTGKEYFEGMLAARERIRGAIGALVGAGPESVALTSSTTEGVNLVVAGLGLGPGDEVVTTTVEHFGLIGALAASGADVRAVEPERLPEAIGRDTRLVALSHVSWVTGNLLPVEEAAASGVPVLVDGAQSVGAIPVEAARYDYYTVSAQKWLCGPDATGALVVRDPESLRVTAPSYFSQRAYDLVEATFEPRDGAARFDSGWIPTPSLAGLEAALADLPGWRYEQARETAARCRERLAERFDVVTAEGQATLVSIRPREDPSEASARLREAGVIVRDIPGTGILRVSCGWWTSEEDLDRLLAAL